MLGQGRSTGNEQDGRSVQHQMTLTDICPAAGPTGPLRRHGQAWANLRASIAAGQHVAGPSRWRARFDDPLLLRIKT